MVEKEINNLLDKRRKKVKAAVSEVKKYNGEKIPLSSAQKGIWYYDHINKNAKFTLCSVTKIIGKINCDIFRNTIEDIVNLNEIFKVNFLEDQLGIPYQYLNSKASNSFFEVHHLKQFDILSYISDESNHFMDLKSDRLIHFTLVEINTNMYYLIVAIHHIISDELSLHFLLNDIFNIYQEKMLGRGIKYKNRNGYLDYCIKESKEMIDKAYWEKKLRNIKPMEMFRPKSIIQNCEGEGHFEILFPQNIVKLMDEFSKKQQFTMFSIFLGGLVTALFLLSGDQRLSLMTPFSNRKIGNYFGAYGMFVHNILLVFEIDYFDTYMDIQTKVSQEINKSYDNSQKSYDDLIHIVNAPKDLMCLQNNIVFTYLENEDFHKRTEDFEVIESEIIKKDEHNNLSVIVSKESKDWKADFLFLDQQLKRNVIKLAEKYINILEECLKNYNIPIIDLIEVGGEKNE
ncbi:hypothetical protein ADH76_08040 [Enterocloster clostridioformis]|nr:condensation domain-containing protein [Enterocloster clostridioformis]ANU49719.1 hypothetical protein A4V08_31695 [Lachnoclostridium sp. YL32]NDO28830.1 hypothetical protein [Enterocloster clostridioformis]OXE71229.1 hypothetical protein ADH76_08040 [Enterocloster clostridioformis]QQR01372.1 hypothetical protein I5Q83_02955 [Enterocloster clostridioformis]